MLKVPKIYCIAYAMKVHHNSLVSRKAHNKLVSRGSRPLTNTTTPPTPVKIHRAMPATRAHSQ